MHIWRWMKWHCSQNTWFKSRVLASEAEHATSLSRRLSILLNLYQWAGKKHFVSLKFKCQSGGRTRYVHTLDNWCKISLDEENKWKKINITKGGPTLKQHWFNLTTMWNEREMYRRDFLTGMIAQTSTMRQLAAYRHLVISFTISQILCSLATSH